MRYNNITYKMKSDWMFLFMSVNYTTRIAKRPGLLFVTEQESHMATYYLGFNYARRQKNWFICFQNILILVLF
jgi:hypothetical protein